MKYVIHRQFSFRNEKFEIIRNSTNVYNAKATPSKDHLGRFNVILSDPITKHVKGERCLVEPDPNAPRTYRIYIESADSDEKRLFGQLSYQLCGANNYLYKLIIGNKLYIVRSCDLKDRRLAIIDTVKVADVSPFHPYPSLCCPQTLFQVTDSFCESNQVYRVNIDDHEIQLGYLAIVILLDLHECRRIGSN